MKVPNIDPEDLEFLVSIVEANLDSDKDALDDASIDFDATEEDLQTMRACIEIDERLLEWLKDVRLEREQEES